MVILCRPKDSDTLSESSQSEQLKTESMDQ